MAGRQRRTGKKTGDQLNNLIQMEAFVQLCETRSFTEAAKQLHISQSYLSKLIRKLEEEYDILLVSRSGGALTLTKAGEKLYDSCSFILSEYHRLDNTLRLMASNQKEQLSVGITHNAIMANFYDPLKDFIDRYPDIEVNIIEVNPELFIWTHTRSTWRSAGTKAGIQKITKFGICSPACGSSA